MAVFFHLFLKFTLISDEIWEKEANNKEKK